MYCYDRNKVEAIFKTTELIMFAKFFQRIVLPSYKVYQGITKVWDVFLYLSDLVHNCGKNRSIISYTVRYTQVRIYAEKYTSLVTIALDLCVLY